MSAAHARRTRLVRHALTLLVIAGATTVGVGTEVANPSRAAADTVDYCSPAPGATCTVYTDVTIPGSARVRPNPGDEVPGDGDELGWCMVPRTWRVHSQQELLHYYFPDAPDDATLLVIHCVREPDNEIVDIWRFGYYEPDDPRAPRPAPVQVGSWLRVGVRNFMNDPQVAADPGPGQPVTLGVPTFVEDTTWQNPIWLRDCGGGVCVILQANPTLSFDPGEPSTGPITCTGAGSRFDPTSDQTPEEQAAGACAHTYTQRTGADVGRPATWNGRLIVTWQITWSVDGPNPDSGVFDDIVLSVDVPREVQELQANVTDAELE